MRACVIALLVFAACTRSAEIGKGYAKALETMADPPGKLDIVFVVDDSSSMLNDQTALVAAVRTELFPQLSAMTGQLPDLHMAVVSTSLDIVLPDNGWSGYCTNTPNGRFVSGGWSPNATPCTAVTGPYLIDAPDGSGARVQNYSGTIEDAFSCMATLGDRGCGIEQPLEALRRALTDPSNTGFLRSDAALLVVFLTNEDDNSGTDPSQWPANDPYFENDRWFEYGVVCDGDDGSAGPRTNCVPRDDSTAISPITPYITFLQSLKADPALVMVAGILPPAGPVALQYYGDELTIAGTCTPVGGESLALDIRLNAFMRAFPARYVLASMCDDTMPRRIHEIAGAITGVMTNRPCLLTDGPTKADHCRAFDVDGDGKRTATAATFIEDQLMCDYTRSHLRADVDVAPGHHVEVECLR